MDDVTMPEIRQAAPSDRVAIERLLTSSDLALDGVAGALPMFFVAVARRDADEQNTQDLVGVAGLEVCCENALLRSVAIAPEWRSRGLGRALVERVIADAESRGIRALYLLTTTAERYFPSFGFETITRERVPDDIRATEEFRVACPASATVMGRDLSNRGREVIAAQW